MPCGVNEGLSHSKMVVQVEIENRRLVELQYHLKQKAK
jgi:hypothetical protein